MTTTISSLHPRRTPVNLILIGLILISLGITGCATTPTTPSSQHKPAEDIYAEGRKALQAQDYQQASSHFKSLEIYYPDSPYNHQAQMELAYAYFKSRDYSSTIATTDRLIRNFPNNENHDYPRYLKALASFEQAVMQIEAGTDQDGAILSAQTSLQYFEELSIHYPNSKYQQDADKRIAYLHEQLAQYEISVARSMIEQGNHASAVVHARNVVENYPQTRSAADALAIIDMGYEIMAIDNANDTQTDTETETAPLPVSVPTAISNAVPLVTAALHNEAATESPEDTQPTETSGIETMPATSSMSSTDIPHPVGTHTTSWIMQQAADHYTIQLISTAKDETLPRFITSNKLDDRVAYYRKQVNGKTWHALIYGVYPSATEARAALAELPESLQRSKPWVQGIKAIQQAIEDFSNNN